MNQEQHVGREEERKKEGGVRGVGCFSHTSLTTITC